MFHFHKEYPRKHAAGGVYRPAYTQCAGYSQACMQCLLPCSFLYDWELEAFAIRPKEFWPLDKARSVLDKMIPQLCHESDGLILQVR